MEVHQPITTSSKQGGENYGPLLTCLFVGMWLPFSCILVQFFIFNLTESLNSLLPCLIQNLRYLFNIFIYRKKSFVTHNFELLIERCSKGIGVTQLSFTSDVPCETEIIMFEFDVNVKITMKASKSIFTLELELYTMPLVCNFKLLIRNYSFDNTSFEQSLISGS